MTRTGRTFAVAAGAVAGAVGLWALIKLLRRIEEDRPPILVNNGSIRFTMEPTASGQLLQWTPAGAAWKPDHPHGRQVRGFQVTVSGSGAGGCGPLTGNVVKVHFGSDTFTIHRHGFDEPAVSPATKLTHDPATRSLSSGAPGSGMITRIEVPGPSGGSCTFTSTDVHIKVRPLH